MTHGSYENYLPTGLTWAPRIPSHWRRRKLKFVANAQSSNVDKNTVEGEREVRLCNYTDVYKNEVINNDLPFMLATATQKEIEKFTLHGGDVIITKDSESWQDIAVPALVASDLPGVLCGYHLSHIRPIAGEIVGAFLYYLLRSQALNSQLQVKANGVTRFGLPAIAIDQTELFVPPADEQIAIVRFLDAKTAEIDALIAKKRQLLDLLAEQRAALITRAVTKGLNPVAPLRPSGLPWLGDIPAHWEVKRLSWLFKFKKGARAADITHTYIADNPGDYPVYSGQTESDGLMGSIDSFEFSLEAPAILVTTVGAKAMSTRLVSGQFSLSQNCAVLIPKSTSLLASYYIGVLQRLFEYERNSISLIMQPSLRFEDLNRFKVPVPSAHEQDAMATRVADVMADVDLRATLIGNALQLLREQRSALITAAVTGQIDVRSWSAKRVAA